MNDKLTKAIFENGLNSGFLRGVHYGSLTLAVNILDRLVESENIVGEEEQEARKKYWEQQLGLDSDDWLNNHTKTVLNIANIPYTEISDKD